MRSRLLSSFASLLRPRASNSVLRSLSSASLPPYLALLNILRHRLAILMQTPSKEELGVQGPPPGVKGMMELERKAFAFKALFPALEVDVAWMNTLLKPLKHVRFMHKKIDQLTPSLSSSSKKDEAGAEEEEKPTRKLLLLDPEIAPDYETLVAVLRSKSASSFLDLYHITRDNFHYRLVDFHYDLFNAETILKWILPDEVGAVTGFSQCGHIVHLNLKDHHLPYKGLIGKVFLDKIVAARTIVNKTAQIHSVYRNFEYEVIAGECNLETVTKESDCSFELDFGKVYWNSRLSTEHERVVKSLPDGAVVYDVFAGIGPFAIPAAKKKKCRVFANDLNPESFKWLKRNVILNSSKKVSLSSRMDCFNLDGRDFLRDVVVPDVARRVREKGSVVVRKEFYLVMNLPAIAIEFLDVLPGCLNELLPGTGGGGEGGGGGGDDGDDDDDEKYVSNAESDKDFALTVYCYCFSNAEDVVADTRARVEAVLGTTFDDHDCQIRNVRNVAPSKEMMVAKLRLTAELLLSKNLEPLAKRQKV